MLQDQQINSGSNDANQLQQKESQFQQSKLFAETFKKIVSDFSQWPERKQVFAIGAVSAIFFTALPLLLAALPLASAGIVIALTLFFTIKAISYTMKRIGLSGEKVVEGIKYSAEKVKDGYKYSIDSLEKGANFVSKKTKEKTSDTLHSLANKLYNAAVKRDYLEEIKEFTEEQKQKSEEIKNQIRIILNDKQDNAGLVKNILSEISSKIDFEIAKEKRIKWIEHTDRWKEQKEFINKLDAGTLKSLLTQDHYLGIVI